MSSNGHASDIANDWEDIWVSLSPAWRRILAGRDDDAVPALEPLLQRQRLTTDFVWVGNFEPIRWLPALKEALLWDDNGMDLGPLTGRAWNLLQLAGPARIDLAQLRGTAITHLILSNVDVYQGIFMLQNIPGLTYLTLAHGDFGSLPPLPHLSKLVLYTETTVEHSAVCGNHGFELVQIDEPYVPPFGPSDQ